MVKNTIADKKDRAVSRVQQRQDQDNFTGFFILVSTLVTLWFVLAVSAHAIDDKIAANCATDYFRYCTQAPINSDEMVSCLKSNQSKLSAVCVGALGLKSETGDAAAGDRDAERGVVTTAPVSTNIVADTVEAVKSKTRTIVNAVRAKGQAVTAVVAKKEVKPKQAKKAKKKKPAKRNRKVQQGGKWDGYPLFLEWNDGGRREYGGEITPYGFEDRR